MHPQNPPNLPFLFFKASPHRGQIFSSVCFADVPPDSFAINSNTCCSYGSPPARGVLLLLRYHSVPPDQRVVCVSIRETQFCDRKCIYIVVCQCLPKIFFAVPVQKLHIKTCDIMPCNTSSPANARNSGKTFSKERAFSTILSDILFTLLAA